MKKAKIMLTAITIMAVVGGALAFKENSEFGNSFICVPNITPTICNVTAFVTLQAAGSSSYFTGNKTQVKACDNFTQCNAQGKITIECQ